MSKIYGVKQQIDTNFKSKVEKILYNYNDLIVETEILNENLNDLKHLLMSDDSILAEYYIPERTGCSVYCADSVVEKEAFRGEYMALKAREGFRDEIIKIEGSIFRKNRIILYVKMAIRSLKRYEKLLIELIYFDRYKWEDVVINFNMIRIKEKQHQLGIRWLTEMKNNALDKICKILYGVEVIMLY